MLVLILFVFVSPVCLTTIPPLPACDQLKYTYSSRGVPEYDIPGRPVQGNVNKGADVTPPPPPPHLLKLSFPFKIKNLELWKGFDTPHSNSSFTLELSL